VALDPWRTLLRTGALTTETIRTSTPPQDAPPAPPAYFLSLTVENFRCFGLAQTLDLSRGENRPAPWTIILGENGVGKTTLLQCLAAFKGTYRDWTFFNLIASGGSRATEPSTVKQQSASSELNLTCCSGDSLKTSDWKAQHWHITATLHQNGSFVTGPIDDVTRNWNLICYGYGASRRMGKASGSGLQLVADLLTNCLISPAPALSRDQKSSIHGRCSN